MDSQVPQKQNSSAIVALAMVVVVGAVMIVQGSLAINTFNTLGECARGDDSARAVNRAQICLLTVGVVAVVVAIGVRVGMYKAARRKARLAQQ
jgi:hypothetical protein